MNLLRIALMAFCAIAIAQAEEPPLKDVKGMACPVNATIGCEGNYCSKKVKRNLFVEHEGRKVYFCCEGCVKEFKKAPAKFGVKVLEQWKVIDAKNKEQAEE